MSVSTADTPFWQSDLHVVKFGIDGNDQCVYSLFRHTYNDRGQMIELREPEYLKMWAFEREVTVSELSEVIEHEIKLNDWSRWNGSLPPEQVVEISDAVYYYQFECVPPRRMNGSYFESGEAHHHNNQGKAVHRAFWMKDGLYYTGYPKDDAAIKTDTN